ncbi:MAG: sigma-70 family RNA polymerase sigma factor, partial [Mycolicibacterium sp.]|nr:sigma-70 family RNA polymerase sigma factor [Mycolicibacterium sp.]
MSDSSPVGADDRLAEAWHRHRPYLVNLAYQMLGDIGEAEDIAQEAYLRLSTADLGEINDVRAWLTVVAGRLCLDQVRSARARREKPGPETTLEAGSPLHASPAVDPADRVTLDDQISDALLEVLRRLSPGERVAFVLHDVFQIPFDAIAETVGRPVGTCRQLARRARGKIQTTRPLRSDVTQSEHQLVTDKFIAACASGELRALTAVLDPTVWGVGTVLAEPAPPP